MRKKVTVKCTIPTTHFRRHKTRTVSFTVDCDNLDAVVRRLHYAVSSAWETTSLSGRRHKRP